MQTSEQTDFDGPAARSADLGPGVDPVAAGRERWQQRFAASRVREADFTTLSGVELDPVYGPAEGDTVAGFERIGWPGEFPFTRGLYPT
ncbi:MAG: hypothetical protein ACRDWY_11530, partial [Actinomycetes bacterium]